jgi:GNAT superfamily N-acetyltransferase
MPSQRRPQIGSASSSISTVNRVDLLSGIWGESRVAACAQHSGRTPGFLGYRTGVRAEELQWQGMRALERAAKVDVLDRPDRLTICTPLDLPFFNGVLHAAPGAVHDVIEAMTAHGRPWLFRTGPHTEPEVLAELDARGFAVVAELPLMACSLATSPEPSSGLEIAPLAPEEWPVWFDVFVTSFGFAGGDLGELEATVRPAENPGVGQAHRALGRLHARPLATGTYALDGEDAILFDIGTLPGDRRAGHGRAMTRWLLDSARAAGARTAHLLSSPAGEALYAELGFETVGTITLHEQR